MTTKKPKRTVGALFMAALLLVLTVPAYAQDTTTPGDAKSKQAYAFGVSAYLWGYPMVVMQKSRDAMTKAGDAPVTPEQFEKTGQFFAPVNQVGSAWGMLGPKFTAVQSGNSDTLYSVTWYDSSEEPYILHLPDAKGRYYTYQFIDAWTNNYHYASTRTMGSQEQNYVLVAPGWKGKLPEDVTRVDCPTPTGFIIGRWFVASESDVAAVNAIQEQVTMTPLSSYGKTYTPPKVPVVPAKKYSGDLAFFEQLGDTLVLNGAPAADAGLLGLLKNIGLTVDHGFDQSALSDGEKKALAQAITDGEAMLAAKSAAMGKRSEWLAALSGVGRVFRQRLPVPCRYRLPGHVCEYTNRGLLSRRIQGCQRQRVGWLCRKIHHHIPQGEDAAGWCVLVGDSVRRQEAAHGRESDQPLQDRQCRRSQGWHGRLDHDLHPGRFSGQRHGIELAAGAEGTVLHAVAHVSAEDRSTQRSI